MVLFSAGGALFACPSACLLLGREWGSWCGTGTAAASSTLIFGGAFFTCGALAGSSLCRRFEYIPRVARFLALLSVTVAVTCLVFGLFILPTVARYSR